jgi:plasmid stabilization system protein ParE
VKKKLNVIWDDEAKRSLKSIYEYIKNRESIRVAVKVRSEIIRQTRTLNQFPEKFEEEPILKNGIGNFRYKVIWSYKIIYEVTPDAICILDIFHTSRDPSNIF